MEVKLVRRKELAQRLGVHIETIRRWARDKKHGLRLVKIGKLDFVDIGGFEPFDTSFEDTLLKGGEQ